MTRSFRATLGVVLLFACAWLVAPVGAWASATVRVEYVTAAQTDVWRGQVVNQPGVNYGGGQTLTVTGATPVFSSPAPSFGPPPRGFARVRVLTGAVVANWGPSASPGPSVSETTGSRLEAGDVALIPVSTGDELVFVEAASPPAGLPVAGNIGGYSFQLGVTPTISASAYSAGQAIGGLITLTGTARTAGGSGLLLNLRLKSNSGQAAPVVVYVWSKLPASTCSNGQTFVSSTADGPYALAGFPAIGTLGGSPGSFDAATTLQLTGLNAPFKNQDATANTKLYACVVATGAVTFGSTSDLSLNVSGVQD